MVLYILVMWMVWKSARFREIQMYYIDWIYLAQNTVVINSLALIVTYIDVTHSRMPKMPDIT
jgi:hypothetical protein